MNLLLTTQLQLHGPPFSKCSVQLASTCSRSITNSNITNTWTALLKVFSSQSVQSLCVVDLLLTTQLLISGPPFSKCSVRLVSTCSIFITNNTIQIYGPPFSKFSVRLFSTCSIFITNNTIQIYGPPFSKFSVRLVSTCSGSITNNNITHT